MKSLYNKIRFGFNCINKMEGDLDKFGRPLPKKQGNYYLPSVTTDALVFRDREDGFHDILLVTRKHNPFQGFLAFPGGFVDYNEDPLEGCLRELKEECSIEGADPVLVTVEGDPLRDTRGHVITIAYRVTVPSSAQVVAADDALHADFYPLQQILQAPERLAFDHAKILKKGVISYGLSEKYGIVL
jgi:8-oxo-dGTP diphosphatase